MRYLLPFCVLLNWSVVCAAPSISNIVFPNTIGKYQKFEISFDLGTYNNPYDYDEIDCWAEFVSPSGKVSKVFGFYYEGYLKTDDGAATSNEILVPTGGNHWKFRFSPHETGHWTFSMTARDSSGTTTEPMTNHFTFEVTPTDEKGFISAANNRYLKYDSGDPYFPIGDSYPWWLVAPWRASSNGTEKGTNIAKHYMDGMAANGVTYNRFELNFYEGLSLTGRDFVLQKTFYSYYNQHDAWQLDEVMDYAKEKGVNINLALWAAADFVDPRKLLLCGPCYPSNGVHSRYEFARNSSFRNRLWMFLALQPLLFLRGCEVSANFPRQGWSMQEQIRIFLASRVDQPAKKAIPVHRESLGILHEFDGI
ncbi:MAG: DUF5060 domain-containing protein [Bacteroidetes bacterium]|nr:DUF5060 domain-containing protein [Bacteroidota bacterium]